MTPLKATLPEQVAQALVAYYRQADGFVVSAQELLAWYTSLTLPEKEDVRRLGPYHWAMLPKYKRFLLERRGYSLRAYLALHLTTPAFAHWAATTDEQL